MNITQAQSYTNYVYNNLIIDLYFEKCNVVDINDRSTFDIMLEFPNINILLCCSTARTNMADIERDLDEYKTILNNRVIAIIDTTYDDAKYCHAKKHPRNDLFVTKFGCVQNANGLARMPSFESRYNSLLKIINIKKDNELMFIRNLYLKIIAYFAGVFATYMICYYVC